MECTTEVPTHELGTEELRSLYAILCEVPDYRRRAGGGRKQHRCWA